MISEAGPQSARDRIEPRPLDAGALAIPRSLVRIRETGAGLELYYPYLRNPGAAIGTLLVGGCFIGFAWLFHAASKGDAPVLFIGLFGVFGLLIVLLGFYLLGNSMRVTAGRRGLRVERGIFGLRITRQAAADEITGIDKTIGMQSRQGSRMRAYYRIVVKTRDGRNITAGNGIHGASRVDALIGRLRQALGLADEVTIAEPDASPTVEMPPAVPVSDLVLGQERARFARRLVSVLAGVLFFAFLIWQFRDILLRFL